jgi:hypothetical protein
MPGYNRSLDTDFIGHSLKKGAVFAAKVVALNRRFDHRLIFFSCVRLPPMPASDIWEFKS